MRIFVSAFMTLIKILALVVITLPWSSQIRGINPFTARVSLENDKLRV